MMSTTLCRGCLVADFCSETAFGWKVDHQIATTSKDDFCRYGNIRPHDAYTVPYYVSGLCGALDDCRQKVIVFVPFATCRDVRQ